MCVTIVCQKCKQREQIYCSNKRTDPIEVDTWFGMLKVYCNKRQSMNQIFECESCYMKTII